MTRSRESQAPRVWYAAYGSNLSWSRFRCYLEGGVADGSVEPSRGARDGSPPTADRALTLPRPIRFAGRSGRWGGGVAFLGDDPSPDAPTRLRLWCVTVEQLLDVIAQENRLEPGDVPDSVVTGRGADIGTGWYRRLVLLGEVDGMAAWTVTGSPSGPDAPPADAYLRHMVDGLLASHRLDPHGAAAYLARVPGVGDRTVERLRALATDASR